MAIDLHAARPTRVSYHRLGDRQGRKRIYLENRTVAYAGFEIGARYRVEANEAAGTLSILLDENGPRIVTRRERLAGMIPVIDVKGSDALDSIAAEAERARVEYGSGKIVVRIHADHLREVSRRKRVQANVASGKPLSIVSLCTGIGVLDHAVTTGMQDAGISARVALAVEVNENVIEQAAVASDRFAPDATLVLGRLQDLDLDLVPEADMVIAGLPCTGASLAGRGARHGADPEAHPEAGVLFMSFLDVIRRAQPGVVVLENVASYANTAGMLAIRAALELWGYNLSERILDGSQMGDLEARRRLCMVAVTNGFAFDAAAIVPARAKPATLGVLLEDIGPDSARWEKREALDRKAERDAAKGNNFKLQHVDATSTSVPTMTAGYARWRTCDPRILHPTREGVRRLLTPREHARVKGVPECLIAGMPEPQAHEALGNSVTYYAFVAVGRAIAMSLLAPIAARVTNLSLFAA